MTKKAYLAALRDGLAFYPWAFDQARVDRYMGQAERGIADGAQGGVGYEIDGPVAMDAWRAIGGKGKPTVKALRALSEK